MFEEFYQKRLDELYAESEGKDENWTGWYEIERLEDILIKYKFKEIS